MPSFLVRQLLRGTPGQAAQDLLQRLQSGEMTLEQALEQIRARREAGPYPVAGAIADRPHRTGAPSWEPTSGTAIFGGPWEGRHLVTPYDT